MMRTDRAGDLRTTDIDREVVVCGWVDGRRDHGGVVFLDVRDVAGILQVVVDPGDDVGPAWTVSETPSRYIDVRGDKTDKA